MRISDWSSDVCSSDLKQQFQNLVARESPGVNVNIVPTLRGTIVAFGGTRVADMSELPMDAWFLRGERGVTYSDTLPEGSALVAGEWWPQSYEGPRSEEHTSALKSLMRITYAVFCFKKTHIHTYPT